MYDKVVLDGNPRILITTSSDVPKIIMASAEFGIYTVLTEGAYPTYTGETVVIPKAFENQTLETAFKTVYQDITVTEIPYNEVSNLSGGLTVSIG